MNLRDEAEGIIRGWDQAERSRGRKGVVDYDCFPDGPVTAIEDRIDAYNRLADLEQRAAAEGDDWVHSRVRADRAYVAALLGERTSLETYVYETQGTKPVGWDGDYLHHRKSQAVEALKDLGIAWGPNTNRDLEESEGRLTAQQTAEEIQRHAAELEPRVRAIADTDAEFTLTVEEVDLDVYWAYWLDGQGDQARMRINLANAQFTNVRARQLALHEILGHALQGATYYKTACQQDVPWVRILSVHAPQQSMLEGLAQAFPLYVTPDEPDLLARTRMVHFTQLIRGELHLRINNGHSITECVEYAQQSVPFWTGSQIADMLDDRANNTLLRSYLWSYPAGMDWYVQRSEAERADQGSDIRGAFAAPLRPSDLGDAH